MVQKNTSPCSTRVRGAVPISKCRQQKYQSPLKTWTLCTQALGHLKAKYCVQCQVVKCISKPAWLFKVESLLSPQRSSEEETNKEPVGCSTVLARSWHAQRVSSTTPSPNQEHGRAQWRQQHFQTRTLKSHPHASTSRPQLHPYIAIFINVLARINRINDHKHYVAKQSLPPGH